MNVIITMKETVYQNSTHSSAGNAISATITKQGYEKHKELSRRNAIYVDVIELALVQLVDSMRGNEESEAVVKINGATGYTLSAGIKTYLTDKYVLQPEIESITFA